MPKVYTHALGCKISYCDNREAEELLCARGWTLTKNAKEADLFLLTACTVTQKADADLRKLARQLKKQNPGADLWIYGCWANVAEKHEPFPEPALVIKGKAELEEAIAKLSCDAPKETSLERNRLFVKVQDGCDRFCAYCIVPFARGIPKSMPYSEILSRVKKAREEGIKECVLSGIHIASWKEDGKDIADLCAALLKDTDLPRLRVSSLDVTGASEKLRKLMIEEPRLMPHLHIPLQSGSDRVLKLMNRPLSRKQLLEAMQSFLEEVPRMMLSTDIIVGFPGETEEDFQETLSFVKRINFGKVHYFPYSPRPGTAAAKRVKDFVPDGVKKEREERLRKVAEEAAKICRAPFQGQTFKVLTENKTKDGILGFTENYLRVCTRKELTENEIYELTIDGTETKFIAQ